VIRAGFLVALAALLAAPAPAPAVADADAASQPTPAQVARAVTVERMDRDLRALQRIADRHGGNRAAGTAGYRASVAYVAGQLRRAGYRPRVQPLSFRRTQVLKAPVLERVTPAPAVALVIKDVANSVAGDVTGPIAPVDLNLTGDRASTSGCEASDFAGFAPGAIALLQRGTCTITDKVDNAAAAGAAGVVLFNQGDAPDRLGLPAVQAGEVTPIPIVAVTFSDGALLATAGTTVHLAVATRIARVRTANVVAQTPAGSRRRVIALGAHLDSVRQGPGINDDGTGVAFLLELARQVQRLHLRPAGALRFGFWAAEEEGLYGSAHYVASLPKARQRDIAAYLNFDMLGSPNGVRYVYRGGALERLLRAWFRAHGLATEATEAGDRSDHDAFAKAGIPIGGLFSGADEPKTRAQWRVFGGIVGVFHDPNYHTRRDRRSNVDPLLFGQLAHAGAFVATRLALHPGLAR
jgi:Zn-dependent M28 family amino/carboxypeptidase